MYFHSVPISTIIHQPCMTSEASEASSLNVLKLKLPGSDFAASSSSFTSSFLPTFLRARKILSEASPRRHHRQETSPCGNEHRSKRVRDRPGEPRYQKPGESLSARGHFGSGRPDVRVARPREARDREIEGDSTTTCAMTIPSGHCDTADTA